MNGLMLSVCLDTWYNMRKCYNLPLKWVTFRFQLSFSFDNCKVNFKPRILLKYYFIYPYIVGSCSIYTILNQKCNILLNIAWNWVLYLLETWLVSDAFFTPLGASGRWGADLSGIPWILGRLRHPQASFSLRPGSLGGLQWLGDQPLTCSWIYAHFCP